MKAQISAYSYNSRHPVPLVTARAAGKGPQAIRFQRGAMNDSDPGHDVAADDATMASALVAAVLSSASLVVCYGKKRGEYKGNVGSSGNVISLRASRTAPLRGIQGFMSRN
ncbi:hypothetical protein MTO96_033937 [Rhipicephalus appendiculatus]